MNANLADCLDQLVKDSHEASLRAGWYKNPKTGKRIKRNFGEMISLIHSELSEALEADRKSLPSEHLEGFTGIEEELADVIIRVCDLAGYRRLRLGAAYWAKRQYNERRADHKLANRRKAGGKAY